MITKRDFILRGSYFYENHIIFDILSMRQIILPALPTVKLATTSVMPMR